MCGVPECLSGISEQHPHLGTDVLTVMESLVIFGISNCFE